MGERFVHACAMDPYPQGIKEQESFLGWCDFQNYDQGHPVNKPPFTTVFDQEHENVSFFLYFIF